MSCNPYPYCCSPTYLRGYTGPQGIPGVSPFTFITSYSELVAADAAQVQNAALQDSITLGGDFDLTIPLVIFNEGVINTNGHTLTIESPFEAGNYQIFSGAGTVVLGVNSTPYILLEWFGALGDGATNDSAAIQKAFDASVANNVWIPITPIDNKVYCLSTTINVPYRATVISYNGRTSGAEFKALAAIIMFQFPSDSGNERQITFKGGMTINGNSLATACIHAGNVSGTEIDGVAFRNAITGIDQSAGGTINQYRRLRFSTTFTTCIKIGGISNFINILECMFAATATNAILVDATWTGGALNILNNVFDPASALGQDTVKVLRLNGATATLHTNIKNNRFDGGVVNSHISIGQYVIANIEGNGFSGSSGAPGINVDGDQCYLANNFLGDTGINFTANSNSCIAAQQKWGGFSPHYTDIGTLNIIDPFDVGIRKKGTTAQRPVLASYILGYTYLDTDLDPDGLPILWQGTKWIKMDGTNA